MQYGNLAKSALWTSSCRWFIRFIGIFSSAFLVRLLSPDDFGLVLKALLIVEFAGIFVETKFTEALIRVQSPSVDDYNTVFTLNVLLGLSGFIVLNIIAPFSDILLGEEQLPFLIFALSFRLLFHGFENPRITDYLRCFHYGKDFLYLVLHKIFSVTLTVIACIYYKNYYGLIVGHILNAGCLCLLSYIFISYKPKFSLRNYKMFLEYGIPNLASHFSHFILTNIDRVLLVRFLNHATLGFYNLAYELVFQLTNEVIYPLSRAFFPIFSQITEDKALLSKKYSQIIQFLIPLCLAIAVGLYLIADELILFYAGEKWYNSIIYFKVLVVTGISQVFCLVNGSILAATGHVKIKSRLFFWQMIISLLFMVIFLSWFGLYQMLIVKAVISFIFAVINVAVGVHYYNLSVQSLIIFVMRSVVSVILMIMIAQYQDMGLFVEVIACGGGFITTHFLLWCVFARHKDDIESHILKYFIKKKRYNLRG